MSGADDEAVSPEAERVSPPLAETDTSASIVHPEDDIDQPVTRRIPVATPDPDDDRRAWSAGTPVRGEFADEPVTETLPAVDERDDFHRRYNRRAARESLLDEEPLPYTPPTPTRPTKVVERDEPVGPRVIEPSDSAETEEWRRKARRGTTDLGLAVLRIGLGLLMAAHGGQKLFGWWNGPGIEGFRGFLVNSVNTDIGFDPGAAKWLGLACGLTEGVGGLLLVLGLFTPVAASAISANMLVAAAYSATLAGGVSFFAAQGGIELELVLAVAAAGIALSGPGLLSVDALWGWSRRPKWGSLICLLGAIGVGVAIWYVFNGVNPFQSPGNPPTP